MDDDVPQAPAIHSTSATFPLDSFYPASEFDSYTHEPVIVPSEPASRAPNSVKNWLAEHAANPAFPEQLFVMEDHLNFALSPEGSTGLDTSDGTHAADAFALQFPEVGPIAMDPYSSLLALPWDDAALEALMLHDLTIPGIVDSAVLPATSAAESITSPVHDTIPSNDALAVRAVTGMQSSLAPFPNPPMWIPSLPVNLGAPGYRAFSVWAEQVAPFMYRFISKSELNEGFAIAELVYGNGNEDCETLEATTGMRYFPASAPVRCS